MKRSIIIALFAVSLWPASAKCQQPVCGPNGCQPPQQKFAERGPARRFVKNLLKLAAPSQPKGA